MFGKLFGTSGEPKKEEAKSDPARQNEQRRADDPSRGALTPFAHSLSLSHALSCTSVALAAATPAAARSAARSIRVTTNKKMERAPPCGTPQTMSHGPAKPDGVFKKPLSFPKKLEMALQSVAEMPTFLNPDKIN